jgi:predicted XRE-type DNA-binding protein
MRDQTAGATKHPRTAVETYVGVWDAIAGSPSEAANLRARTELMRQIAVIVKDHGWSEAEAAHRFGLTQPRMNDLLSGRVSRFSIDTLVNVSTAIACAVHIELRAL